MQFTVSDFPRGTKILYKAPKREEVYEAIVLHVVETLDMLYIRCYYCGCKYIGMDWVVEVISPTEKTNPNYAFKFENF